MRIEILYDFDFTSFEFYKNGLNKIHGNRFSGNKQTYYLLEHLKIRDNIESLYLLGTGLDKICIAESKNHKCFIIEPCPAMFFICSMEETFKYFVQNKRLGKTEINEGGIYVMESSFRPYSERGEWEIHAGFKLNFAQNEWQISIGESGKPPIMKVPFQKYLSGYFDFAQKSYRFYEHILPEFKNFKLHEAFYNAVFNSEIKNEFKIEEQSSLDDLTYYDLQ